MRLRFSKKVTSRNVLVIVDTAIAAAMSVVLLLVAARSMSPDELSDFSLLQLIAMTLGIIQRAFFLSPALTSQRTSGRSSVPVLWTIRVSLPVAAVAGALVGVTLGVEDGSFWTWAALGLAIGSVVLVQDTLRFCLFSRGTVAGAVVSDCFWFLSITALVALPGFSETAESLGLYWCLSGVSATCIAFLWVILQDRREKVVLVTVSQTWRLGKWSGIDALMSATANLTPMLMTALVLGSDHAGTYRVLQSALGPLNILSASLMTLFGLDAWKLVSKENLNAMRARVRRVFWLMLGFAIAYLALAEVAIIAISGLRSPDLVRISIVVALVGALGAATSPLTAAALALGYQRHGAILRVAIVTFSIGVSLMSGLGLWLPWNDPIGVVTLFAAVASLVGWAVSYGRAHKRELQVASSAASTRKSEELSP